MENKQKEAVIMLGLPASGKSTYIKENYIYKNPDNHVIVSADDIRVKHPRYDPQNPEAIHEECVALAEQEMYRLGSLNTNIVMDGGGINNSYTLRIVNTLKSLGYFIKVVYINTPARICIARNAERVKKGERFVPKSSIIDKSYKLQKSVEMLLKACNYFCEIPYFTNKYWFVDMDGCVAAYQDLVADEHGNIDYTNGEIFKYAKPVTHIIDRLGGRMYFNIDNIRILSASPNSICNDEKSEWLDKNMPFIKKENRFFVGNKQYKVVMLENLIKKFNLNPKDVTLLDDEHKILEDAKRLGVNVMHPSMFLAKY